MTRCPMISAIKEQSMTTDHDEIAPDTPFRILQRD